MTGHDGDRSRPRTGHRAFAAKRTAVAAPAADTASAVARAAGLPPGRGVLLLRQARRRDGEQPDQSAPGTQAVTGRAPQ